MLLKENKLRGRYSRMAKVRQEKRAKFSIQPPTYNTFLHYTHIAMEKDACRVVWKKMPVLCYHP